MDTTSPYYLHTKKRELEYYKAERDFQKKLFTGNAGALWLIAVSRIAYLEKEIEEAQNEYVAYPNG